MVTREFEFICSVMLYWGDFLRYFSVRSVLTSVHSVTKCGF